MNLVNTSKTDKKEGNISYSHLQTFFILFAKSVLTFKKNFFIRLITTMGQTTHLMFLRLFKIS